MTWTIEQLVDATGGRLASGDPDTAVSGVALDSRQLKPQEAFLAIRGARFDAHRFVPEAVSRGAGCLIVSQPPATAPSVPTICVDDTVVALGQLAAFHRASRAIPVVAITGSCGKTTTKELIAHLLDARYRLVKTAGTQNNQIGLPLTLLKLAASHEMAIVELGSNHPGEIAYLASIARPTVAVITNVGPAHLQFFGSIMGVLREKLSLLEALGPNGVAVVPGDQLEVVLEAKLRLGPQARVITFGTSERCDVQALDIRASGTGWLMRIRGELGEFVMRVPGSHNVENALAALACVKALGLELCDFRAALAGFAAVPMRSEVVRCEGLTVMNDCYNANPLSFARALETLRDLPASRRIVVAGEMLELGDYAVSAHQAIGRLAAQCGADVILAVGAFADDVARGARELRHPDTRTYGSVSHLLDDISGLLRPGDALLVKGSRGMKLEQVVHHVTERFGAPRNPHVSDELIGST